MISAAGYWNSKLPQRGFSLLEMLIVILILGILYSLAGSMLNLSVSDPLHEEADRLYERIRLAQDETLVRSQALALGFAKQGYGFFAQNEQQKWEAITHDRLLGQYRFLREYDQELYLQGQAVRLGDEDKLKPQVFILPTGEMLPFEWRLQADNRERVLKFDNNGRFIDVVAEGG